MELGSEYRVSHFAPLQMDLFLLPPCKTRSCHTATRSKQPLSLKVVAGSSQPLLIDICELI